MTKRWIGPRRAGKAVLGVAAALVVALSGSGCESKGSPTQPDNVIDVTELFFQAYSEPETFDNWLATHTVSPGSAACLRQHSQVLLDAEQDKLIECDQLIMGSDDWNECHDEAEALHNSSVLLDDIARALDGTTRFAETDSGQFLIFAKSVVGDAEWNALVEFVREIVDRFQPLRCTT